MSYSGLRVCVLALVLGAGGGFAQAADDPLLHAFRKIGLADAFYAEGANVGDFNRDGVTDVVSGPFWYEGPDFSTRHEIYPAKTFDREQYSDHFFPHAYDFNGDGWSDILVIGFPGQDASWYENPGASGGAWQRHLVFEEVSNESPFWGDLTGDGRPEIVCISGGRYGHVQPDWSDPSRPWTFHPVTPQGSWSNFTHGLGVGDVNGDGRSDLLEKDGWWEQPPSLENDPEWTHHPVQFGEGGAQMFAYDVDGDGDQDVITSLQAHGYGLAWYEQVTREGRRDFVGHVIMNETPAENRYGVSFSQPHALTLADMDRDGVQDIVTGKRIWAHGTHGDPEPNAAAVLYWFRIVRSDDGQSVDFVPYLIDDDSGVGVQVVATDVNGDAWPDVVVGNKKGAFVLLHEPKEVSQAAWEEAQPKPYAGADGR